MPMHSASTTFSHPKSEIPQWCSLASRSSPTSSVATSRNIPPRLPARSLPPPPPICQSLRSEHSSPHSAMHLIRTPISTSAPPRSLSSRYVVYGCPIGRSFTLNCSLCEMLTTQTCTLYARMSFIADCAHHTARFATRRTDDRSLHSVSLCICSYAYRGQ